MTNGIRHNAFVIAQRLEARGPQVEAALRAELDVQAQKMARIMRAKAPKFQTILTNSVHVESPTPDSRVIAPDAAHAWYVEKGVKPGGKGLPRYFDPARAPIVAWLQSKAFSGHAPRAGSKARTSRELQLRDRYEGLAWHIRHRGTQAQPFVKPTFDENVGNVSRALALAFRRGLTATDGGSASA